jgi:hypothetical protein
MQVAESDDGETMRCAEAIEMGVATMEARVCAYVCVGVPGHDAL